jgi:hypothetical protein
MIDRKHIGKAWVPILIAGFGLATACAGTGPIQDPLGPGAKPAGGKVDLNAAAQRQLELQSAADDVEAQLEKLRASEAWSERGYFTAAEHDAIEGLLFRFVTVHRAFWGEIDRLGGVELTQTAANDHPAAHLLVLHAGLALATSSSFLVMQFQDDPVAIAKLNEAFYRSEIPAETYDQLRLAVTSTTRQEAIANAWALHQEEQADPGGSAVAAVAVDPPLATILASLPDLRARWEEQRQRIDAEHGRTVSEVKHGEPAKAARHVGRSFDAVGYETRSVLFKNVSRIKSPSAHLIRFSADQKRQLADLLRPGDVILTYTAGYISDVFIPGVFKHGITYVGDGDERAAAGLSAASVPVLDRPRAAQFADDMAQTRMPDGSRADLIEAVAEGVKFSNLEQILDTHVNRLAVLRPQIDAGERTAFLAEVFAYLGDPYDFEFDFADATRQVCTEVIYRGLNGKSGLEFALVERAGHPTLSADDIVVYHFAKSGRFEVVAFAEEDPERSDHAARVWERKAAEQRLKQRMADPTGDEN